MPPIGPRLAMMVFFCVLVGGASGCGRSVTPPAPVSCEGVTCSGHGVCVLVGQTPVCICDTGFHAVKTTCVADEPPNPPDPCAAPNAPTCSGNGVCASVAGQATCICDVGYRVEGLECVQVIPDAECVGVTCDGQGTCVVVVGEPNYPLCVCNEGYEAAGTSCLLIETCTTPVTYYHDDDGDTYVAVQDRQVVCEDPDGTDLAWVSTLTSNDCDDADLAVYPGATEASSATGTCYDGKDNDCDTLMDEADADCVDTLYPLTPLLFTPRSDSIQVAVPFFGDENQSAAVTLYWCNETIVSGCDPQAGDSVSMALQGQAFVGTVAAAYPGYDPGDLINIRVRADDSDGVAATPWESQVVLGEPTPIYRSVGGLAAAVESHLSTGAGLVVYGDTVTFAADLSPTVGVGDALHYVVGSQDQVAFVHGRSSASTYRLANANGGLPEPGTSSFWGVYRAYRILEDAEQADENESIPAAVRNFDPWLYGRDLVAHDEQWNIACYADTIDTSPTNVVGWTTDATRYLRIYTPTSPSEVGVSQRHTGAWGDGYQRSRELRIAVPHLRVDGLSIRVDPAIDGRAYFVSGVPDSPYAEIHISNTFGWVPDPTSSNDCYDFYATGTLLLKVWNAISINEATHSWAEAFYLNDADITAYFYNCTAIAAGGRAFQRDGGAGYVRNSLAQSGTNLAFNGTWAEISSSAAHDDSCGDGPAQAPNKKSQDFSSTFVDLVAGDARLDPSDTVAVDEGVDLSADLHLSFTDDIQGETRTGAWDMGADEL